MNRENRTATNPGSITVSLLTPDTREQDGLLSTGMTPSMYLKARLVHVAPLRPTTEICLGTYGDLRGGGGFLCARYPCTEGGSEVPLYGLLSTGMTPSMYLKARLVTLHERNGFYITSMTTGTNSNITF